MRRAGAVLEVVVALALGRVLIGGVTGESASTWLSAVPDWRWLFALPCAALLAVLVHVATHPDAFD